MVVCARIVEPLENSSINGPAVVNSTHVARMMKNDRKEFAMLFFMWYCSFQLHQVWWRLDAKNANCLSHL